MGKEEIYKQLKRCVEVEGTRNESECGKWLGKVAKILLPLGDETITYVDSEQTSSSGRVDLIIIADSIKPSGTKIRKAFIWELKAPQVYLYEVENKNRARPSDDLYSAENQLLHYHDTISQDGSWRTRWGITPGNNVVFGGIIIGRKSNFVAKKGEDLTNAKGLAEVANEIREKVFYQNKIKLWTWDEILLQFTIRMDFIDSSNEAIIGKLIKTSDISATESYTTSTSGSDVDFLHEL